MNLVPEKLSNHIPPRTIGSKAELQYIGHCFYLLNGAKVVTSEFQAGDCDQEQCDELMFTLFQHVHCKKNYEIPGFFVTKTSRDWDWIHYSRPGRVW